MTMLLLLALAAQDTVVIQPSGRYQDGPAERRAVAVFNAPATMRVLGDHTIARDVAISSDVAVLDGPLRIEGRVVGNLVAINAEVSIVAGAEVTGDLLILGGRVAVDEGARVGGTVEQHIGRLRVRLVDQRLEIEDREPRPRRLPRQSRSYPAGRLSLALTTEGTYNRVEGLPIVLGPRITWRGDGLDARLETFGIFRTSTGLDFESREVGYRLAGRFRFGGRSRPVELNFRVFDQVLPMEDWQLQADEVGWSSVLFRKDYRDYFLADGLGGGARYRLGDALQAYADVVWLDANSVSERHPWSLARTSSNWRQNPAIDAGEFTELRAGIDLRTRRSWSWNRGARLKFEWLHGAGENVTARVLPATVRDPIPATGYRFDRLFGDLRLHQRLVGGGISLRAVAAGELGSSGPLPVQHRLSLGGPDPMPGYDFRRFSCNDGVGDPALPALCDRLVLFQAEFRTGSSFDVGDSDEDDDEWWGWRGHWFDWDDFHFVLFTDAGAAWNGSNTPDRLSWDVGAGINVGGFGLYFARALEEGRPVRGVLRLHRRF